MLINYLKSKIHKKSNKFTKKVEEGLLLIQLKKFNVAIYARNANS